MPIPFFFQQKFIENCFKELSFKKSISFEIVALRASYFRRALSFSLNCKSIGRDVSGISSQ